MNLIINSLVSLLLENDGHMRMNCANIYFICKIFLQQLRRLNQAVFPVAYNDKFYKEIVTAGELAKLAYFNDIVVGGVCCRIDTQNGARRMYIMTLGTLAPYRR